MAKESNIDDRFDGPIDLTIKLFKKMECISEAAVDSKCSGRQKAIKMLDIEKMRCRIPDCLVALQRLHREEKILK